VVLQPAQGDDRQEHPLHDGALVRRIVAATEPTFEGTDAVGDERIFGVARLAETGTTIAVGLKRSDVLAPSDQAFRADLLFLLFVTIGSAAAALLVAEFSVLRGVRLLKSAALRLKAGRMGLRVTLPPFVATELHDFAATYNAMTAEFERLAYLDRLTGLPNRRYLERQLSERGTKRGREAVLAIDLDGFKPVNDTHGHAVGDRVLAAVARRINDAVTDRGLLARVGGDEFAAIMPLCNESQTREIACGCAEDIRKALEQPIEIDGVSFPVGCSIGVAIIPDDASTLAGALAVADAALYEAKRAGRNRVIDHAPPLAVEAFRADAPLRPWAQLERVGPW
jgi:diguanylate cyclase (GGDEF)-like protein